MLVGQAGKVVSGELGDLIQGLDLVLQLHLAAAGPGPSGSHNSWLAETFDLKNKIYHTVNRLRSFLSSCHPVIQSLGYSVTRSFSHSVTWSFSHLVTWSFSHLVTWSLGHSVTRSLSHWSLHHSVTRSLGHLVTQSIGHYSFIFNVATN